MKQELSNMLLKQTKLEDKASINLIYFTTFGNCFVGGKPRISWLRNKIQGCSDSLSLPLKYLIGALNDWPWWLSGITFDTTAVKCCVVCVRSQVWIPARDYNFDRSELDLLTQILHTHTHLLLIVNLEIWDFLHYPF